MEKQMQSRIDYSKAPSGAMKAMQAVQQYVNESGLEPRLLRIGEAARFANQRLRRYRDDHDNGETVR
jgi:hypothetical protein